MAQLLLEKIMPTGKTFCVRPVATLNLSLVFCRLSRVASSGSVGLVASNPKSEFCFEILVFFICGIKKFFQDFLPVWSSKSVFTSLLSLVALTRTVKLKSIFNTQ